MPHLEDLERSSRTQLELDDGQEALLGRALGSIVDVSDMGCSRRQCLIRRDGADYLLVPLSAKCPTLLNLNPVRMPTPLAGGDVIACGSHRWRFCSDTATGTPSPPPAVGSEGEMRTSPIRTITLQETDFPVDPSKLEQTEFRLETLTEVGRDPATATLRLKHPLVSRRHALVREEDGRHIVEDLRSSNGTFVNGRRLRRPHILVAGDSLGIGPYFLEYDRGVLRTRGVTPAGFSIVARSLCREVEDRNRPGASKLILDDVSLVVEPRQFLCILGPSGSGKTTTMVSTSSSIWCRIVDGLTGSASAMFWRISAMEPVTV